MNGNQRNYYFNIWGTQGMQVYIQVPYKQALSNKALVRRQQAWDMLRAQRMALVRRQQAWDMLRAQRTALVRKQAWNTMDRPQVWCIRKVWLHLRT